MRQFYTILLLLLPNFAFLCFSQIHKSALAACGNPIAKVISFDNPYYRFGTSICDNTSLRLSTMKELEVVCRYEPKTVVVKHEADLLACPKSKYDEQLKFSSDPEVDRGSEDEPSLLQPYGVVMAGSQVKLKWRPVSNASKYEVIIDNGLDYWRSYKTTNTTQLIDSLKAGQSYQVLIFVDDARKSTNVLKILSQRDEKSLLKMQSILDSQKTQVSKNDFLIMKLGLFSKFNLLNESIKVASTEFSRNPDSQITARMLGDLYVDAFRPNEALLAYQHYLAIARVQNNNHDIFDARRRIEYVASYIKQ